MVLSMTFQIDTFMMTDMFGIRWEKGIVMREGGCELLSSPSAIGHIYELEF